MALRAAKGDEKTAASLGRRASPPTKPSEARLLIYSLHPDRLELCGLHAAGKSAGQEARDTVSYAPLPCEVKTFATKGQARRSTLLGGPQYRSLRQCIPPMPHVLKLLRAPTRPFHNDHLRRVTS